MFFIPGKRKKGHCGSSQKRGKEIEKKRRTSPIEIGKEDGISCYSGREETNSFLPFHDAGKKVTVPLFSVVSKIFPGGGGT